MKRTLKIILSIMIILTILGGVTIDSMYCAPVIVPLAQWGIPIVAKALIATGLTFLSFEAIKAVANQAIAAMPSNILGEFELQRSLLRIQGDVFDLNDTVWNWLKNWVDTNYNVGENVYTERIEGSFVPGTHYALLTTSSYFFTHTMSTGGDYSSQWKWDVASNAYRCIVNEEFPRGDIITANEWLSYVACQPSLNYIGSYEYELRYTFYRENGTSVLKYTGAKWYNTPYFIDAIRISDFDVTGVPDTIDNVDYNYSNINTGDRSICLDRTYVDKVVAHPESIDEPTVVGVIDDYVAKTPTDIAGETVATPVDTQTGLLDGILGKVYDVNSSIKTLTNTVERFFDLTQPINWQPLKVVGSTFTTRFPFSLPWDLKNSFNAASGSAGTPNFDITVPASDFWAQYVIRIDLSIFSTLLTFARTIELLLFDIGLILITRKILGGDA